MAKVVKSLGIVKKPGIFDRGIAANLPEAYRKFYKEWKLTEPTAVHYIPQEGKWHRDEVTGEVYPIQNVPLPLKYPVEFQNQIWGGEAIVQGYVKRGDRKRRVPHFWVPTLKRSVVYSEVLDKHVSVVITNRTIHMIHAHFGFDHYLLKTPACDLQSLLALSIKRNILKELEKGCPGLAKNPEKQAEVLQQYKQYLDAYTSEEIDWYGYSYTQACKKIEAELAEKNKPVPLKLVYRAQLIDKLKEAGIKEAAGEDINISTATSWIQKINPFGKKQET